MIHIDAVKNSISMDVSDEEIARRRSQWKEPAPKVTQGTLYKYTKLVSDASRGCGKLTVDGSSEYCDRLLISFGRSGSSSYRFVMGNRSLPNLKIRKVLVQYC